MIIHPFFISHYIYYYKIICEMKKSEMIGEKFGRLTVLNETTVNKNGHQKYNCLCDCGNYKEVFGTHLRENKIQSCGCLRKVNGVTGDMWYKIVTSGIKRRIKRSKLDFNITKEYVNKLFIEQEGKCKLSGIEITLPKCWNDKTFTASLDRIDSNVGYIEGNVQWVHKHINIMKNVFPEDLFIYFCKQVSNNNQDFVFNGDINGFKFGLNEKYRE